MSYPILFRPLPKKSKYPYRFQDVLKGESERDPRMFWRNPTKLYHDCPGGFGFDTNEIRTLADYRDRPNNLRSTQYLSTLLLRNRQKVLKPFLYHERATLSEELRQRIGKIIAEEGEPFVEKRERYPIKLPPLTLT